MDEDSLKLLLAQGVSVEEIGRRFGKDPSTISYWMRKFGLEAPNREKYAAKGGIDQDLLTGLVAEGASIAEIADRLGCGTATVRHWLRRYDLVTAGSRRAEEAAVARHGGVLELLRDCERHGRSSFILEGRGYYRCKRCRQERVSDRRRAIKQILVAEAGGACAICGYARYLGALQFHHLDPAAKRLEINARGTTFSLDALRREAEKCVVLCANCHAEVENGVACLPDNMGPPDGGR